ncbi:unnamed protein product, partial [Symbiodinium pilosum]
DMTTEHRDVLSAFLDSGSSGNQPSSNHVVGMLKQMKEEVAGDLRELANMEKQRMDAMGSAQLHFARMLRLGELKVEAQMVKDDIKDKMDTQTASAHATITVEAWNDYKASQAEEIQALSETVEFLQKNDVQNTIRGALKSSSLVQRRPFSQHTSRYDS